MRSWFGTGMSRWVLPYFVAVGLLFGPAYVAYQHFDPLDPRGLNDAANSYLPMAIGQPEEADVLHTYRVLVPGAAGLVGRGIDLLAGSHDEGVTTPKHARMGFLLVNLALVSLAATFVFRLVLTYGVATWAAAAAATVFLTSRHAVYLAGAPMVDSLYLVAIATTVYALRVGSLRLTAVAVLTGLLAKEAYVLFLPIVLWYGPSRTIRRILLVGGVVAVVFVFREVLDPYVAADQASNLSKAVSHVKRVTGTLRALADPVAWIKLSLVFNLFTLVPFAVAVLWRRARLRMRSIGPVPWLVLPVVIAHMLLSGNVERMALLAFPLFCIVLAIAFETVEEAISARPFGKGIAARS